MTSPDVRIHIRLSTRKGFEMLCNGIKVKRNMSITKMMAKVLMYGAPLSSET